MTVASQRGSRLDFLVAVRINVGSSAASSLVWRRSLPAFVSFRRRHRLEHVPLRSKLSWSGAGPPHRDEMIGCAVALETPEADAAPMRLRLAARRVKKWAEAGRWSICLNSLCLPTAPRARSGGRTSTGCCWPPWPTPCSKRCAAPHCGGRTWPERNAKRFGCGCSRSAPWSPEIPAPWRCGCPAPAPTRPCSGSWCIG